MNVGAEGGLTAVTTVLVLLLIAAIFNRVHGQGVNAKGDRVIAGLLALPLITLWVQLVFPKANLWWALLAPLPLAIYVVLFSLTGLPPDPPISWENLRKDHFALALLVSFGILYLILGILYLALTADAWIVRSEQVVGTSLLRLIAWVATAVGVLVAAGSLFLSMQAQKVSAKAERARFWLELRKMFAEHDDKVHKKLIKGGDWYKDSDVRPNEAERADVIPYLGLFEHCYFMLDQGLIDKETFIAIYRYRLKAILRNGPIKTELLRVGKNGQERDDEEGEEPYRDFKELVKRVDDSKKTLQTMLANPRGGTVKQLTSSPPQRK